MHQDRYRRVSALATALAIGFGIAGCSGRPAPVRISVVMKKYAIQPAEIRVPRGRPVELTVTTADVQHGFSVRALGIREPVPKGRPAVIRFTADQPGEYAIQCSIICGAGHDDMRGKLVVE